MGGVTGREWTGDVHGLVGDGWTRVGRMSTTTLWLWTTALSLQIIPFLIVCCLLIFTFHLCFLLTESETEVITKALEAFSFSVAIETQTGNIIFIFIEMRLIINFVTNK